MPSFLLSIRVRANKVVLFVFFVCFCFCFVRLLCGAFKNSLSCPFKVQLAMRYYYLATDGAFFLQSLIWGKQSARQKDIATAVLVAVVASCVLMRERVATRDHDAREDVVANVSWICSILFNAGRVPQLVAVLRGSAADDFNPRMFAIAVLANASYIASLLTLPEYSFKSDFPFVLG